MYPKQQVPNKLQGILWSVPVEKLDLEKDKVYIINQVLMYGNFDDIRWLFRVYPRGTIRDVFTQRPKKVYSEVGFHFIKDYILDLKDVNLPTTKYVNTLI